MANEDLKIHYHSAPPMADTGYGVHTKNLVSRLKGDFDPIIHSVGGWEGMGIDWQGVQVYPSGAGQHGEESIPYWFNQTDSDVVFSHHDHWSMADTLRGIQQNGIPMILYTIVDHALPNGKPPKSVVKANEHAYKTIVMSEWAEDVLSNSRIDQDQIQQIPHGVNTTKYAPVQPRISKEELKRDLGIPEDAFLFGMVAANYGPRKNLPQHMEAFKRFIDEYDADDAYLYIHTHPTMTGGFNLYEVREALDLDPDRCLFPDGHKVYHGIDDLTIVQLYNTYDVHMNVTQSESWGMTVTEAMSCGTPVIGANNSAMTEQFGVPYDTYVTEDEQFRETPNGLLVHRGTEMWTQNATARRFSASVDDMVEAMAYYYNNRDKVEEHGENAREWVVENYAWDKLYEEEWKPLFEEVKDDLLGEQYNRYYFKRREAETQSQAFMKEASELSMEVRGDSVIDVGAGTGTLAKYLEERGFDVTAVEKAEAGLEYIRDKGIEAQQGDITDLLIKDNSYDTAVSQHVLEHVDADAYALKELYRVARERVVCIVPGKGTVGEDADPTEERRYDERELERLNEEFSKLADEELEYRQIQVGPDSKHWLITVDVGADDA